MFSPKRRAGHAYTKKPRVRCPRCRHLQRAALITEHSTEEALRRVCCLECGHVFHLGSRRGESTGEESGFGVPQSNAGGSSKELRIVRFSFILLAAVALTAFLGIRIGMSRAESDMKPPAPLATAPDPARKAMTDAAVEAANASVTPEDQALREFLGKFLAARSWKDLMPLVRNQNVTGLRMEAHYGGQRIEPYEDVIISTKATKVGKLIVLTLTGKNVPNHRLIVEKTGPDYKVDWESFVIWQEAPWKTLRSGERKTPTEIRCLLKPVPNNHPSFLSGGWLAYELYQPLTKEILYAYMRRIENLPEKSPRAILADGATGPCTLLVKPITDEEGKQLLEIEEVLALGWVHPLPTGHGE